MRIAALYDIHANRPALEAVLGDVRRAEVEELVIGGDVLPGPMPLETLAALRTLQTPARFIRGNGDREVLAAIEGRESEALPQQAREILRWAAKQLGSEEVNWIRSWPETLRVPESSTGGILFCHATPRNDFEIFTEETSEERLLPVFEQAAASVVVCGHTHIQFDRNVGATRVLNAGSVGMPFGEPGAYWLLLEGDQTARNGVHATLRRTPYDLASAAREIRRAEYPHGEAYLLRPPSKAQMLESYARVEIR